MDRLIKNTNTCLNRRLNDEEIAEELIGFMFAGSGTAANTTVFLMWAVARDRRILDALVKELKEAIPSKDEVPEYNIVNRLPYLNAVVMEALRMWPTIPGTQPRVVVSSGLIVAGQKIPVGVSPYTIILLPRSILNTSIRPSSASKTTHSTATWRPSRIQMLSFRSAGSVPTPVGPRRRSMGLGRAREHASDGIWL